MSGWKNNVFKQVLHEIVAFCLLWQQQAKPFVTGKTIELPCVKENGTRNFVRKRWDTETDGS